MAVEPREEEEELFLVHYQLRGPAHRAPSSTPSIVHSNEIDVKNEQEARERITMKSAEFG